MSETLQTWFIYNTKMFKDYGLNKQTPRTYYEKNDWTWARMQELADKFVKKNASKEIVQWGLTMQTGDLIATTGLELVSGNGKGGYVYNLKDAKVAKMMNLMYDMGTAGSGSLYTGDAITGFKSGKVAMIITNASTLTVDFNDMRKSGRIDWVPMPKMDASSNYYNQSSFDPAGGSRSAQRIRRVPLFSSSMSSGLASVTTSARRSRRRRRMPPQSSIT